MIKSGATYRYESMLFNEGTTSREDYRFGDIKAPGPPTVYKPKQSCMRIRPPPLKDIHTLTDWNTRCQYVPFYLYHTPKDIVRTNPREVQKSYFEPPDEGKENAIKTRPRLVMTPSVSMDDIEDPKARELLIDDMYTSDMTKGLREAIRPYFKVQAPFPGLPADANPIRLPKILPPYVSPEWRMDTVTWDQKQLRSYCDTTRDFWLSRELRPRLRPGLPASMTGSLGAASGLLAVLTEAGQDGGVKLPRLFNEPVVSPEWRMDSASWDSRQLWVYVDPTKNFWLKQKPACQECKNTAARMEEQDLMTQW